jgi:hypothetical protein
MTFSNTFKLWVAMLAQQPFRILAGFSLIHLTPRPFLFTMMKSSRSSTFSTTHLLLLCFVAVQSFRAVTVVIPPSSYSNRIFSSTLHSTTVDADISAATITTDTTNITNNNLLTRDRYIATNRFTVRKGREAKFEKRWATRKSKLATLDGFKYFHLMRRVKFDDIANTGKKLLYTQRRVCIFIPFILHTYNSINFSVMCT